MSEVIGIPIYPDLVGYTYESTYMVNNGGSRIIDVYVFIGEDGCKYSVHRPRRWH